MSHRSQQRTRRGFTMIELVVVIGIIALATAFLIRMVSLVKDRVGDVTCQGNLRQLLQALQSYNLDHNGSMPYGFFYVGSGPPTWVPPPGGNNEYISWASEVDKYFNTPGYAPAFQCPDAQQQVGPHPVSYVMNMIVAVSPVNEIRIGATPPRAQTKPPRLHLMLQDGTAVIWDTAIAADLLDIPGYLTGTDVDRQRFWNGAHTPQYRYYSPDDVYAGFPPGILGNERPVQFDSFFRNLDPAPTSSYPYQGNLRFRHAGQTQCNVAFSDGSVRQFTATIGSNNNIAAHNALRKYFMIHWPPRVTRNPAAP